MNEEIKNLISRLSENDKTLLEEMVLSKMKQYNDINTMKGLDFEKELSLEVIYEGRMLAMKILKDFISELRAGDFQDNTTESRKARL